MGLNVESRSYVESMCPGSVIGLLTRTQDEIWDFFEKLAWDTYAFEQARMNFGYPSHDKSVFHANHCHQDHSQNSYDPSFSFAPHILCDYVESSDHDVHNCPYHDYVDAICANVEKKLTEMTNKIVETMK